jgi:hypothetical protein
VQQTLDGALPHGGVLFADAQHLAGEGQLVLRPRADRTTERTPQLEHPRGDVRASPAQGRELGAHFGALREHPAQVHRRLRRVVLHAREVALHPLRLRVRVLAVVRERLIVGGGGQAERRGERFVPLGPCRPLAALLLEPSDLGAQALHAVTALRRDGAAQLVALPVALLDFGRVRGLAVRQAPDLTVEDVHAAVEQVAPPQRKVRAQGIARTTQPGDGGPELGVPAGVLDEGAEAPDLVLGAQDRLVGAVEVVEVMQQRLDARRDVERLQHVFAHEVRQIADRFHRHRLMKQIERLLVLDAEPPPERRRVGRETVEDLDVPQAPQALAQRGDVGAELGEVLGDVQARVRDDVEPRRLRLRVRVREREHLGERHRLCETLVVKVCEQHGVRARFTQRDLPRGEAGVATLGLVDAEHITAGGALAGLGPGGAVVCGLLRGHEQRRQRVDERRLARADVPRDECVLAVALQGPDALVKRAPVVEFEAVKPEPRALGGRRDVEEAVLCRGAHGASPSPPAPARVSRCSRYSARRVFRSARNCASTNALRMRRIS